MEFKDHYRLRDKHAFLSPSQFHWVNYTDQKLEARFRSHTQAARGTSLHKLAKDCIELRIKLSNAEPTLAAYVRDGIGYKMTTEQVLYYSDNCFGSADTISFRKGKLRIHDLKTGLAKASFTQLEIYAALFCLEYDYSPSEIDIELRIYQKGEVLQHYPDPSVISNIMETIIYFDKRVEALKEEE